MKPAPFLRSRRLEFRPPDVDDAPRLAGWVNDPEVRKHIDQRAFPMGVTAERDWIAKLSDRVTAKTDVVLLAQRQSDTEPIGTAGLHGFNWLSRSVEFGLLIARDFWGQGYGREITDRMLEYGFTELNLDNIRLRVNASHERARRCYVQCGFQEEGTMRRAAFIEGRHEDVVFMSVLRSEWEAREPPPAILA